MGYGYYEAVRESISENLIYLFFCLVVYVGGGFVYEDYFGFFEESARYRDELFFALTQVITQHRDGNIQAIF